MSCPLYNSHIIQDATNFYPNNFQFFDLAWVKLRVPATCIPLQLPCWSASACDETNALIAGYVMLDIAATAAAVHITLKHNMVQSLKHIIIKML